MRGKRFLALLLAGVILGIPAVPGMPAAAQGRYAVIDEAPPTPSITKFSTKEWDAGWYRMETDLQKGVSIYSFDYDPTMNEVKNENPEDYLLESLPDQFLGCDYIISRKDRRRELYFFAEQTLDIYVAAPTAYGSTLELGWLAEWEKTADTLSTKDGTVYAVYQKRFEGGQTVRLPAFGKDNDGSRNLFVMALPAEGKAISNALTHNPVVEAGTPAQGGAADGDYAFYVNDVYNMETGDALPKGYEEFSGAKGDGAILSEKTAAPTPDAENYALNRPYETSNTYEGWDGSPVDGNVDTYWESSGLPASLTIDLEQARRVDTICLKLRSHWGDRSQNIMLETSLDGRKFTQLFPAKDYTFEQQKQNVLELAIPETEMRFLRLNIASVSDVSGHAQLSEVEVYGPNQAAKSWGDRHVEIQKAERASDAAGLLKKLDQPVTGQVVLEAKVRSDRNNQEMLIPALLDETGKTTAALRFSTEGYIQAAALDGWQNIVPYTDGEWYTLKLLLHMDTGAYDVYVNHMLKAEGVPMGASAFSSIRFSVEKGALGRLEMDNLRLYDNPEVYSLEEDFNGLEEDSRPEEGWTFSDTGSIGVSPVPFDKDRSLSFTAVSKEEAAEGTRRFTPISGKLTVEAKVKADSSGWVTAPAVVDDQGRVAAKVAMYRNSFFISNGDNWVYICNQELPHNYYPAGNWYQLKLVLDTDTNRYDFYVDGAKRYEGAAFAEDLDAVSGLWFAAHEPNTLYVDNIKIYDSDSLARGLMPKDRVYNVKDFGAEGDGVTDDTDAIRRAIEAAAYTGGTVLLENGVFYTGQITLYSDMTFFLDSSASILAKMDRNVYKKVIPSRNYNANHQLGRGIIYCQDAENVRITGGGSIDGNGFYAFNQNDPPNQRPCILYMTLSRDLYVENLHMVQSPFWTVVPLESENITIRNVGITNHVAPNRDGIDPVNSSNITIENCCVFAGDDALCPKSGNDIPSYNMDVRNCLLQSYCNAIKLGTDSLDDFKNYTFTDICIKNVGLSGIALESSDGSEIENLTFRRIDMNDVDSAMFAAVGNRYRTPSVPDDQKEQFKRLGYIRNITVEDMNYTNPMEQPYSHKFEDIHEIMLIGMDPAKNTIQDGKEHRISNVLFKNVYLEMPGGKESVPDFSGGIGGGYPEHTGLGESTGWAYTIRWADNVRFENCRSSLMRRDVREEIARADYRDAAVSEPIEALYALGTPDVYAAVGTAQEALPLPETVPVLLENNQVVETAVESWKAEWYNADKEGSYTFTAVLKNNADIADAQDLSSSVTVILEQVDRSGLEEALAKAAPYLEREEDYTAESWQKLADAVKAAEELPESANQTAVSAAADAIEEAIRELKSVVSPIPGDLDEDGEVTIADVMEACKVLARKAADIDPTADEIACGDLDEDGDVTIADVMEICKTLARQA